MIRYYSKLLTFRVEKSYGTRYMSMQYMLVNLFCVFCALCLRGFNNICEHEAYSWRFYGVRSRSSFFFSFSKRMKKIFPSILSHARKFIGYVILDFLSPFFFSYLSKLRGLKMWIKIEFQTTWERCIFEIRRWNHFDISMPKNRFSKIYQLLEGEEGQSARKFIQKGNETFLLSK